VPPTPTSVPSTPTPVPSTPTPVPQGEIIIVTSTADSGPGTLRQALLDAGGGDTITFDPDVFPPDAPATIYLTSGLPHITQGNLAIDASDAGVILDGRDILEGEWICGLTILSDGNTIRGLQIINFTGAGFDLEGANHNTIGGDRSVGSGPVGQGNLSSGNADGIVLYGASDNLIAGNLIGTNANATEAFANQHPGVAISDGARHNVIGPDNIIAYNNNYGIDVRDLSSTGNTITQNSIRDNAQLGINTPQGGDAAYLPPVILEHDMVAGTVAGATCPGCIVEIFSDDGRDGEIYEGQATADNIGYFALNKGSPFTGPHLTATTTDAEGKTSEFSLPTFGASRRIVLQEENVLPRTQFQTKQSKELADNRIGSQFDFFMASAEDMQQTIDLDILPQGLKRLKLSVNGIAHDTVHWNKPELTIDPSEDQVFTRIANNDITITYVLTFWDKATWPGGEGANCPRFKTEEEIQRYLDFVRFIVRHFKDRVRYFEIWNEPDIGWDEENIEPCIEAIDVDDYINLVRRAVPVIRQEYPDAKIVVGSTMPQVVPGSREYLLSILNSDIMPLVDVVAWHPGGPSPEYEYWQGYYEVYPSLVQEIKDMATAHGFQGEFFADEFVWWTEEDVPPWEPWTYSDKKAAKYFARFILMHLGMDVTVLPGGVSEARVVSFATVRNLCTLMAGAEPVSLPVEIESQATNIMSYAFSLPDGDRLFALWTHGVAADDDSSTNAALTFPGLSAGEVAGIDVLYGFEQQVITNAEGGNLVIRDLLVKDYPIILRLTP
jgi:hypothetical protein